jgi:hypothetical protein
VCSTSHPATEPMRTYSEAVLDTAAVSRLTGPRAERLGPTRDSAPAIGSTDRSLWAVSGHAQDPGMQPSEQ